MTADRRLAEIRDKVHAGTRLTFDDGLHLDRHADLFTLGELANLVRERKNGDRTYYNVNTHLNPTNVCVYRCSFCSFRADLKGPNAYVMTDEQILGRAREATEKGCTELHIVGGLHHQLPYEWYLGINENIHREFPVLHLKEWKAV
jgi:aminodeoxyfutalosine synthase